jgi:hypothetical protein
MGEFARYGGERIKIGTCENMYYLRADQRFRVAALCGNVDPVRDAPHLRFRFPFPDEDHVAPGAFDRYDRAIGLYGVDVPTDIEHGSVQFTAHTGYRQEADHAQRGLHDPARSAFYHAVADRVLAGYEVMRK